ncbi:MAG: CDP-glucose 4,6-dehydratase [Burkholderiaceae bacterium]
MEEVVTTNTRPLVDAFWQGKRVLVTGHTGFKGGWLVTWLKQMGAAVTGIALPADTKPSLFELAQVADGIDSHFCDIRKAEDVNRIVRGAQPEIVMHLAAQPLVRASYRDPVATFACNVMGTVHLLDALRNLDSVRVALMVTTDKVYRNAEQPFPYREDDVLGGHDPYSASKAASEFVIASYRDAFLKTQGVAIASARAGNVMGGGDWSEDRLIPDAVRAWQSGHPLNIRRPQSIRPWQHVLEPLHGYLALAQKLWRQPELAGPFNFGPNSHEAATVRDVIELARKAYGRGDVQYDNCNSGPHETGCLTLEIAKSRAILGLKPRWDLSKTVNQTMAWYCAMQNQGFDAGEMCRTQIAAYTDGL